MTDGPLAQLINHAIQHRDSNSYWKKNPEVWRQLFGLLNNVSSIKGLAKKANGRQNAKLRECIAQLVPEKLRHRSFFTQAYVIMMGLESCQKCKHCGKDIVQNASLKNGFRPYCSISCANKSQDRRSKAASTLKARYGHEHLQQIQQFKEKSKRTLLKKFGADCVFKSRELLEKRKQTWLDKYGVENPNQADVVKHKKEQHFLAKYGVKSALQSPDVQKRREQTCKSKYGVDCTLKVPKIREQIRQTNLKKYGVENAGGAKEVQEKIRRKYLFDSLEFDSAPEIAVYLYLRDHSVKFEYHPTSKAFWYMFEGSRHRYFPDFAVGDEYWEVKGDHLYRKMLIKGTLQNAKLQCMKAHNVKILCYVQYSRYVNYVKAKYGKHFLPSLKRSSYSSR